MKYLLILLTLTLSLPINAQTLTWSAEFPVTGGNNYNNVRPRIALTTGNTPIVMWGDDINSVVFTAKWNGSGFTTPVKIHSDSIDVFTSYWAGPEIDASGDTVFIGLDLLPDQFKGTYSIRSTDGGLTFDDTVRIDNIGDSLAAYASVDIANGGNPVFTYMRSGTVWMDYWKYTVVQSTDGGDTFEKDVQAGLLVTGEACDCCPATVKTEGQRQVLMFRNNDNNLRENWMVYSDDGGTSFIASGLTDTTNWVVNQCPSYGPDFIISGNTLHSTWLSRGVGGGVERIYVGSYDINTMKITFQDTISSGDLPTANFQRYSRMDGEGDLLGVVFQHISFGNADILFASSTTGTAGLIDNFDSVNTATVGSQLSPDIAYADGTFHIVWQDEESGDVMYRNVSVPYTSIATIAQPGLKVTVSPNPFHEFAVMKINRGNTNPYSVEIYDASGRVVRNYPNQNSDQLVITKSDLRAGMYFYKFISIEYIANGKFIISE